MKVRIASGEAFAAIATDGRRNLTDGSRALVAVPDDAGTDRCFVTSCCWRIFSRVGEFSSPPP